MTGDRRWEVRHGDALERLREIPDCSVDALVCDPPAGIAFMGKSWDADKGGRDEWIAWLASVLREAARTLKPGAHALIWALPRTSHWTGMAIEDAGLQVRDRVSHLFGSGFPKSHNLPGGYGTALKPAAEDWWLARKPLAGTVAATVSQYGTGALNIDGCRIEGGPLTSGGKPTGRSNPCYMSKDVDPRTERSEGHPSGRWPANVVLSHSPECREVGTRRVRTGKSGTNGRHGFGTEMVCGAHKPGTQLEPMTYADADGMETVPAWDCAPDCPVALLDAQSGERRNGGLKDASLGQEGTEAVYGRGFKQKQTRWAGDAGGASRFFLTVKENPEHEAPGGQMHSHGPMPGVAIRPENLGDDVRFRYCAKASRREREAGLEGMPAQKAGVGHRATDQGEYLDFVHQAPEGIGAWLRERREAVGLTLKQVAKHFPSKTGGLTGCVTNWEQEYNRPTPEQWWTLKAVLGFDGTHDRAMTETRPVERQVFDDRERATARNVHPTVKPIALMRWLARLVTPPGGLILDPFCGSGSTGCAAVSEGFRFLGIEQSAEYVAIAERRIAHWAGQADPQTELEVA